MPTPERRVRASLLFAGLIGLSSVAGCASAPAESDGVAEGEVRTAKCPATVELAFDAPIVSRSTPSTYHDGTPLSGAEVAKVADGMREARELSGITLSLGLETKRSGRCNYGSGEHAATLRTKGGRDILDVRYGKFRLYLFPTAYETSGLSFDRAAEVSLFVNVDAAGSRAEGASLNVEIGKTKLRAGGLLAQDHAFIEALVADVGEYFHVDGSAYEESLAEKPLARLPRQIRAIADRVAAEEAESLAGEEGSRGASPSDEAFEIVRDGRTIGYVLQIEHFIDHPLWDGSGVRVYVDTTGEIVASVSWTG